MKDVREALEKQLEVNEQLQKQIDQLFEFIKTHSNSIDSIATILKAK